jgi:hypothetical protein
MGPHSINVFATVSEILKTSLVSSLGQIHRWTLAISIFKEITSEEKR